MPAHRSDAAVAFSLSESIEQIQRVFSALERDLIGFGPLLIQSIYALLTRENLLIFSPPGTAKTLYAHCVFRRIRGARVFDTQMSKGTLAEELFGSIDTRRLKRGRIVHNTRRTLVDADLAFIDEFFDANDMVLRALLGVFNERVFKKGSQCEPSRLHTGIAAANYLRATEVTEAVLDRFLFRAYLAPDYDPCTLVAVDQAFARHYGRRDPTLPEEQIPLEHLARLADIVRGMVPQRTITAPPHVLLLKNVLLNRYRELVDETPDHAKKRHLYISPRTYAKTRIVLNASALLRGRTEVTAADLAELKYVVTTVGARGEQMECFEKALSDTLLRIRGEDLERIDHLASAYDLAEQVMARVRCGEPVKPSSVVQRILRFFGLVSEGDITFDHVRRFVEGIQPADERVKAMKLGVLRRIQELGRRVDHRGTELLR
ncbi:MAG: MoxR family ATPase [Pirellulales bacterium]|nr:MoxR family ATPase [Pirellulales bacterium]